MGELEKIGNAFGRAVDSNAVESESVLEAKFWEFVSRTDKGLAGSRSQLEIGPYRTDSIFDCDGEAVVVELDGTRYHQDYEYDSARDRFLVNYVSAVIRIPYKSLWHFPQATFGVLASWFPRFKMPLDPTVINCRTTHADLQELANRDVRYEVFDASPSRGWVGFPSNFIAPNHPWSVTIARGKTDPKILEILQGTHEK